MCGIIVSNLHIPSNCYDLIKNRGPDYINKIKYNNIDFVHFLLHLTGEQTIQPIIDDGIVCLFNGEIYNYKDILPDAKSDVYRLFILIKFMVMSL